MFERPETNATMRPGIGTRPSAAMTRTLVFVSRVIGLADMGLMVLPPTSKLEGVDSAALLPSKIRAF